MSERLFGRYILIKTIGVGGMAEVSKARLVGAKGFSRPVALKMTLPHLASDKGFIEAFVREAKLVSLLDHPNIVKITDFGGENSVYYIAMDYIWGKDLKTIIVKSKQAGKPIEPEFAAHIISQVCQGLDYAHNLTSVDQKPLNLVHRDISPQNILLSYGGEVKILDFGIAKVTSEETLGGKTQAEVIKGKVSYMSPEQAEGKLLDARSDLFSLGIVFYELVTGKNPFVMKDPILTLEKVRHADYINTSDSGFQAPKDLEHILKKCLLKAIEKDSARRYQSAGELNCDIEDFLHGRGKKLSGKNVALYLEELFTEEKRRDEKELEDENRQVKESETAGPLERVESETPSLDQSSALAERDTTSFRLKNSNIEKIGIGVGIFVLLLTVFIIWQSIMPGSGKIIVETKPKKVSIFLDGQMVAESGPVIKDNVSVGEP
ncbi:MAG: serine/threonine protein kinase, partial [Nitrospinota bacterium]